MTTPQGSIREEVFFSEQRQDDNFPSENLIEFAVWFQGIFNNVPPEFRDVATIEFAATDYRVEIEISYTRPRTQADLDKQAAYERDRHEELETRERFKLAELKLKYEDKS